MTWLQNRCDNSRARWFAAPTVLLSLATASFALGQAPGSRPGVSGQQPRNQVREHPLAGPLRMAQNAKEIIDKQIPNYTCTLVKRQRSGGKMSGFEHIFLKVRHDPKSYYMYFLGPKKVKGREVLFVQGKNNDKLLAHEGSGFRSWFGSVNLTPGKKYPIHQLGILYLTRRLIELAQNEIQYGECEVRYFPEARVNGVACTCVQILHPLRRKVFRSHVARIFFDDKLGIPIRYESYTWPEKPGGKPVLVEEYSYKDLNVRPGLNDVDFDARNRKYRF